MNELCVSVVIPVYNRPALLKEAINSVLTQERILEVIVVDDGSDDQTPEVIAAFARTDPRVVAVRAAHSGMPGQTRNVGARVARGRYLAFLDSDDIWEEGKIAAQTQVHEEQPGIRISHTREKWIRGGRTVSQQSQRHRRSGDVYADALVKCILGPSTVMMSTDLFFETDGFRGDLEIAEDYEYWVRICDRHPVAYLDTPFTVKRAGHGDQLSEKYGHIEIFRIAGLRDLVDRRALERLAPARRELARKCRVYAAGAEKRGRKEDAAHYLELAAVYDTDQ